ncbi:MAG: hypothetical protein AB8B91_19970 [Rubripirellula sp.]
MPAKHSITRWSCFVPVMSLMMTSGVISLSSLQAQMVYTQVPFQQINSTSSTGSNINWNLQGPNWFANFGGGGPLLPPFGGPVNGGVSGGFGFGGGGVSGNLGFSLGQGSSSSISSTTPSLTTMNGYPGSISSSVVRPFVTGFTPIVGDYVGAMQPMESSAEAGRQIAQQQMSTLRQSQASLHNKKLSEYLRRAEKADERGDKRVARANYRGAIALASEPLRSQLQLRMQQMLKRPVSK